MGEDVRIDVVPNWNNIKYVDFFVMDENICDHARYI